MPDFPTELELRILKVLWRGAPRKVREIREALAMGGHAIAHTTVITVLNIMLDKGYVARERVKNAYLFSPVVEENEVSSRFVGDLVERVFDGSASSVMLNLLETNALDADELQQLRRLINRLAREQKDES